MKNIEEALVKTDFKELGQISHQLKGTSGSLKIEEIFKLARALETSAPYLHLTQKSASITNRIYCCLIS